MADAAISSRDKKEFESFKFNHLAAFYLDFRFLTNITSPSVFSSFITNLLKPTAPRRARQRSLLGRTLVCTPMTS